MNHFPFVALAAFAIAAILLYLATRELRPAYQISRSDPVPVRDLQGRSGPVEIEGRAERLDEAGTVTAPITGTECLVYTYDVEQTRGKGSRTLDEGSDSVHFVVSDATGSVRVDPHGADLRLAETTEPVSPGEDLPEHIEAYVAATEGVETQGRTVDLVVTELHLGREKRFTERRLDVGESVYVYGQARPSPATEWGSDLVDAVVGDGDGVPAFVVSDTHERATAWRYVRPGLVFLLSGLFMLGSGILLVLVSI